MQFTEISPEQLINHQKKTDSRYMFCQDGQFAELAGYSIGNAKILAVIENEEIIAYGIFSYYQHKKIFRVVKTQYGPVLDYNNKDLLDFYFDNLVKFFKKDKRVTKIVVNPFILEKKFDDINYLSHNEIANEMHEYLIKKGYKVNTSDFYSDRTLVSRCIFTKDISNIKNDEILKNVSQIARYTINKTIKEGVQIRDLNIDSDEDWNIFESIMDETSKRLGVDLVKSTTAKKIKEVFKDRFHIKMAYIDCDHFIEKSNNTINLLETEKKDLVVKLEQAKVNEKKAKNKLKEIEENIKIWNSKIEKIEKLKNSEGNIINISVATFIECGQDLIYFSSGNIEKFSSFEGPYALNYEMMKFAIENKFKFYNFFSQSRDFSEKSEDYRVLQFKRNFNGRIEWFMENYELSVNFGFLI